MGDATELAGLRSVIVGVWLLTFVTFDTFLRERDWVSGTPLRTVECHQ